MIVEVWQRVMDLAKTGTSGMDTQDEFNGKTNAAQGMLQEQLIDAAEDNQKATDALAWLKVASGSLTSDSTGRITMPDDYLHLDTVSYIANGKRYPTTKLRTNQVDMVRTSPVLGPDLTTYDINYYFKNGALYTLPEQAGIVVDFLYYKKVPNAAIVLTQVSSGDSDLVTPSVGTDFGWPISVFNILVYMILEQLGVELKEEWLLEYARFGIIRETIKTTAQ